jgi:hypothetical protein
MRWLTFALALPAIVQAHDPISTKLTWAQEISRIIYKRCSGCHRPEGKSPMSLLTYEEARPWAKAIKEQVLNRQMPPWGAVKGFGDFSNDASLTQDEMNRIAEWVEGGAPEGDAIYLPPAPKPAPAPALPRGVRTRRVTGPVTLLGIRPTASAESTQVVAHLPDGSTVPLLWLRNYNAAWNRTFVYREPVTLPSGVRIEANPSVRFEFLVQSPK